MDKLAKCVSLFHNNLFGPMGQHGITVLHAGRHDRCQDVEALSDDGPGFLTVCFQQTVENLYVGGKDG